jgi:AcrR family transcriptional regulator
VRCLNGQSAFWTSIHAVFIEDMEICMTDSLLDAQAHGVATTAQTVEPTPSTRPVRAFAGRRAVISREELIDAALALLGPERSISTLSLREISREAGIAPNSFYRHFRDVDELAIALIDRAGSTLRSLIGEARQRASADDSVVRSSIDVFMEQLVSHEQFLHLLLREGRVGSVAFKHAVEQQLCFFEDELRDDLIRLEQAHGHQLHEPALVARAITRLVFAMGAVALDQPVAQHAKQKEQLIQMIQLILAGARMLGQL